MTPTAAQSLWTDGYCTKCYRLLLIRVSCDPHSLECPECGMTTLKIGRPAKGRKLKVFRLTGLCAKCGLPSQSVFCSNLCEALYRAWRLGTDESQKGEVGQTRDV
jgi:predicted RNA-binding Zn-ribbon protein involved in translation (DUF1610 family)